MNCYGSGKGAGWGTGGDLTNSTHLYTLLTCEAACEANPKCDAVTVRQPTPPPLPICAGGIAFNPGEQILGPSSPSNVSAWKTTMDQWKSCVKTTMNYTGGVYGNPALKWAQTSYIQPQMYPYDRLFFDPIADNYTVQVRFQPCCDFLYCFLFWLMLVPF